MHSNPRTCSSDHKAIDAMLVPAIFQPCSHSAPAALRGCVPAACVRGHVQSMEPCAAHAQEMEQPPRKVGFFPVVDGERLVGMVTLHSLVSAGL